MRILGGVEICASVELLKFLRRLGNLYVRGGRGCSFQNLQGCKKNKTLAQGCCNRSLNYWVWRGRVLEADDVAGLKAMGILWNSLLLVGEAATFTNASQWILTRAIVSMATNDPSINHPDKLWWDIKNVVMAKEDHLREALL